MRQHFLSEDKLLARARLRLWPGRKLIGYGCWLAICLVCGCGSPNKPQPNLKQALRPRVLNIGLVLNVASPIGDLEAALFTKLRQTELEKRCELYIARPKDIHEYFAQLTALAEGPATIIFAVGSDISPALLRAAQLYPDKWFVLINGTGTGRNVIAAQFDIVGGAYLAGTLAGTLTTSFQAGYYLPSPKMLNITTKEHFAWQEGFRRGFADQNKAADNHNLAPEDQSALPRKAPFPPQASDPDSFVRLGATAPPNLDLLWVIDPGAYYGLHANLPGDYYFISAFAPRSLPAIAWVRQNPGPLVEQLLADGIGYNLTGGQVYYGLKQNYVELVITNRGQKLIGSDIHRILAAARDRIINGFISF